MSYLSVFFYVVKYITGIYIYIYIYIYCNPQTDCFIVSQLFSVAKGHLGWCNG